MITECLNRGFAVDILFIDFIKAFDLVPHLELILKLKGYGFKGKVSNWIKAFLTDRKQRVVIDGVASEWRDVLSGVPQGSVLGPLLFIIFINDLPTGLTVLCKLFADDSKLMHVIRNAKDREELQLNINSILKWTVDWKMGLNLSKCKIMHLGNKKIHQDHHYSFELDEYSYTLENSQNERDLGIQLQSNLKWDKQVNTVVSKAQSILCKIKNSFKHWDLKTFKILFTTYVRPILEYGAPAWCPYRKKDIKKIEKVQRRATKLVPAIRNKKYGDRLKLLGLATLEERRNRGDLIQLFKFSKNINNIEWFHPINTTPTQNCSGPASSTRQQNKLYRQLVKSCSTRYNFFTNRIIPEWNALPDHVKNASSVNGFKNSLDKHIQIRTKFK
jgi:hypothetical protein